MQATTGPGGVVHGTARTQLDRAHAQRIIGITSDGDQGLIALAACRGYVRGVIEGLTGTEANPSGREGHE